MRSFFALATLFAVVPFARAQDDANRAATQSLLNKAEDEYRTYFKRPETTYELWAAIKFEIDVGKFDLAALHLKQFSPAFRVTSQRVPTGGTPSRRGRHAECCLVVHRCRNVVRAINRPSGRQHTRTGARGP